jgi:hypothetical protein
MAIKLETRNSALCIPHFPFPTATSGNLQTTSGNLAMGGGWETIVRVKSSRSRI